MFLRFSLFLFVPGISVGTTTTETTATTGTNFDCITSNETDFFSFSEMGLGSKLRITVGHENEDWEASVKLGTVLNSQFQNGDSKLILKKKKKNDKDVIFIRLKEKKKSNFEEMVTVWGSANGTQNFTINLFENLKLGFILSDKQVNLEIIDKRLDGLDAVKIETDIIKSEQCIIPQTSTITTTEASTTTSSTPTTTESTSTNPASNSNNDENFTSAISNPTKASSPNNDSNSTIVPNATNATLNPSNITSTVSNPTEPPNPETTTQSGGTSAGVINRSPEDCNTPWWTWVCIGLACAFFILFFVLLCYTIVLFRRNWKLSKTIARQAHHLRGRQRGYEDTLDLQYYAMNNQNLMVGSTIPRLRRTPSPLPPLPAHCTAPRNGDRRTRNSAMAPISGAARRNSEMGPLRTSMAPWDNTGAGRRNSSLIAPETSLPLVDPVAPWSNTGRRESAVAPPIKNTGGPLDPMAPWDTNIAPTETGVRKNSIFKKRSTTNPPVLNLPPPPSPPPQNFLELPPDACLVRYPDGDLNEMLPLNTLNRNNRMRCSDGGFADDEVSDASLGEYDFEIKL